MHSSCMPVKVYFCSYLTEIYFCSYLTLHREATVLPQPSGVWRRTCLDSGSQAFLSPISKLSSTRLSRLEEVTWLEVNFTNLQSHSIHRAEPVSELSSISTIKCKSLIHLYKLRDVERAVQSARRSLEILSLEAKKRPLLK